MSEDHPFQRGQRYANPLGRTARFVEAVRQRLGPLYIDDWLCPRVCQFEDCVVWTSHLGKHRLDRNCGPEIEAFHVIIKVDDESNDRVYCGKTFNAPTIKESLK